MFENAYTFTQLKLKVVEAFYVHYAVLKLKVLSKCYVLV